MRSELCEREETMAEAMQVSLGRLVNDDLAIALNQHATIINMHSQVITGNAEALVTTHENLGDVIVRLNQHTGWIAGGFTGLTLVFFALFILLNRQVNRLERHLRSLSGSLNQEKKQ
jgi:hypothetical protein